MDTARSYRARFSIIALCLLAAGCGIGLQRQHSSNLVDYLYPGSDRPMADVGIPHLALPLDVGIAFVPSVAKRTTRTPSGGHDVSSFNETEKARLMKRIAARFRRYDFVRSIQIIPTAYLRAGGGFENLLQLQRMLGIDVIALVSFDQVQFTDEDFRALAYWTIVGAYVIPGEKNDTRTLLDAALFDIESRKLLFRAPGTSVVKGVATPVSQSEKLRADSVEGFRIAAAELSENLDRELELFRKKVEDQPTAFRVTKREGYAGSSGFLLVLASLVAMIDSWRGRPTKI